MPKVSIIIPTYNHARFVGQAVDSALAQTYPDVETIVVDDGSTDETRAVLDSYQGQINYIFQENRGLSAARNTGIRAAQGDYFLFLDADDLVPVHKLELQVPLLASHAGCGLVYSGWQFVDEQSDQVLGEMRPKKQGQVLKDLLRNTFFFPPGAALVHRECFDRVGLFDESLRAAEDTDMWVRIAAAGYTFGYVDEVLFYYRTVKGSMSRNLANQAKNEFARLDKFFANPHLSDEIRGLKADAYSTIFYEFSTKYFNTGEIKLGQEYLRKAIATSPALAANKEWLLDWIAGFAQGPDVLEPERFINLIFDNLPPEATILRHLRQRAHGRYHTAAAFSAFGNHRLKDIRRHILPALRGDPAIIRNRGFVSIAVQSLLA